MGRSLKFPRASVVLVLIAALVVPVGGIARANHPAGSCLDLGPESDSNPLNTSHVVTATLRTPSGGTCGSAQAGVNPTNGAVTIHFEISGVNDIDAGNSLGSPDMTCTIQPSATNCTVSYVGSSAGTDSIRGWVDEVGGSSDADEQEGAAEATTPGRIGEADSTDVVSKTWVSPATATNLDCAPDTATNQVGTSHTIGCTARNQSGTLLNNTRVDVEASGANDPDNANSPTSPDFTCTTGTSGTCQFTHGTGTGTPGTTTYRAWVDADNSNSTVEADLTEGQNSGTAPGSVAENDNTDVMTKTWLGSAAMTISPTTDSGSVGTCNPFTITMTDSANQGRPNLIIDVEQIHQLGSDGIANNEPTVSFCTPTTGANPTSVDPSTGDRVESPDNLGTAGGEAVARTDASGRVTIGVAVAPSNGASGVGNVTITAFHETTDDDDPNGNDLRATATKSWVVPEGRTIDCAPKQGTTQTGLNYNVTCTVFDRFGHVVSGQGVVFTTSGPGTLSTATTMTTNQFGQATVTATSLDPGVQTITGTLQTDLTGAEPGEVDDCDRAANNPSGAPAGVCSSSVTHTWTQAAVATAELTPNEATTRVGGRQTYAYQVRDATGRPVAGVPVSWALVGVGRFVSRDAKTDANGTAFAVVTSKRPGNTGIGVSAPGCSGTCLDGSAQHWGPRRCTIFGTNGSDVLRGTNGRDTICGFRGNDTLVGKGGDDIIFGNRGNDRLKGGAGTDQLKGGKGNDRLSGGAGMDFLWGGSGNDVLNGNRGRDGCEPGRGRDRLRNCEGTIVPGRQQT